MDEWQKELDSAKKAQKFIEQSIDGLDDAEFKVPDLLREEFRRADVAVKKLYEAVKFFIEVTESGDY